MRLLIDTHCVIWYVDQDHLLSPAAHAAITDPANDLLLSAATIWEIAIKVSGGKLTLSASYRDWIDRVIADLNLVILPVKIEYAAAQVGLPWYHRDPFDRLLIAQTLIEVIPVVSTDAQFDAYGVSRVW